MSSYISRRIVILGGFHAGKYVTFFGIWPRAVYQTFADVSDKRAASIFYHHGPFFHVGLIFHPRSQKYAKMRLFHFGSAVDVPDKRTRTVTWLAPQHWANVSSGGLWDFLMVRLVLGFLYD